MKRILATRSPRLWRIRAISASSPYDLNVFCDVQPSAVTVGSFWDSTTWRDEYYERLIIAGLDELTPAQTAEREYCRIEKLVVGELIHGARHIADLGCGTGRVTHAAVARYSAKSVVGVDLSRRQLDIYRDRLPVAARKRVRLIQCRVSEMPTDVTALDLALFCNHTFGAILGTERARTLARLASALRPGGVLAIVGFSNLAFVADCYHNWGMRLLSIDPATDTVELATHTSLWESPESLDAIVGEHGFIPRSERRFDLGYVKTFRLARKNVRVK